MLSPCADLVAPALKLRPGVAALIGAFGSVQSHVRKVGRENTLRRKAGDFEDAERGVVLPQNSVHVLRVPRWITKFECIAMPLRQRFKKAFQPFHVDLPKRRQLKNNCAE